MDDKEFDEQWEEEAKLLRIAFEEHLRTMKKAAKKAILQKTPVTPVNKSRKKLSTFPVKVFFINGETLMPFYWFDLDSVLGNPEEIGKLLENRIEKYIKDYKNSPTQSRNQNQLFVELVDKYKLPAREIYPLLDDKYPEYDSDAKRRFRHRLQAYYRRVTRVKRVIKK